MYKDKQSILANAKKLKGSSISISKDFSEAVRRKRKFLWEYGKRKASDGACVNLKYDKLFLDGQIYVYDESRGQVVQTTGRMHSSIADVSFLVVNCRSIKNKVVEDLHNLVCMMKPSFVLGPESWLDDDVTNIEVFPSCYTCFRNERNRQGGGVFILLDSSRVAIATNLRGFRT